MQHGKAFEHLSDQQYVSRKQTLQTANTSKVSIKTAQCIQVINLKFN